MQHASSPARSSCEAAKQRTPRMRIYLQVRATQAILLSILALTGCIPWPGANDPRPPDEILWNRAQRVADQQRCDVARVTLRTLINTYPDSKYAPRAEHVLRIDPRLQPCRQEDETSGSTIWYVAPPDVTN